VLLNYRHPLLLATCAMGFNGLAVPLRLPLARLYVHQLSLLCPSLALHPHSTIFFHLNKSSLFFMVYIVYTILLKFIFFKISFTY
jgi:hypothetical protein